MDSARRLQRAGRARLAILAALFVVAVGARAGDRRAGPQPTDEAIDARNADLLTRRINSPNDLVRDADGSICFTDPPYGLEHGPDDPARELAFSGVFRIRPDGAVELISDALSRPNDIAISPDKNTLYVANSDPVHAVWTAFTRGDDGRFTAPGVPFFDATPRAGTHPGLPNGMALDRDGNLFATGPGGVLVLSSPGEHLGTPGTARATANCAFGENGRSLLIAADDLLLRVRLTTVGRGFDG